MARWASGLLVSTFRVIDPVRLPEKILSDEDQFPRERGESSPADRPAAAGRRALLGSTRPAPEEIILSESASLSGSGERRPTAPSRGGPPGLLLEDPTRPDPE